MEKTANEHLVLKIVEGYSGPTSKPEAHLVIKKDSTVTWKYSKEFYIKFDEDNNPCVPHPSGDPNVYPSSKSAPFQVTCTINTTKKPASFRYAIYFAPPTRGSNGHCQGCCIDTDSEY